MTEHTLRPARSLREDNNLEITVLYTGADESQMKDWLGTDICFQEQRQGNLGDRINRVFASSFNASAGKCLIIGIDSPDISREIIDSAFDMLSGSDVVIGPAKDGGFDLL